MPEHSPGAPLLCEHCWAPVSTVGNPGGYRVVHNWAGTGHAVFFHTDCHRKALAFPERRP
jgi:hypothetical protein